MEIEIPAVPAGVLLLLAFFGPYAVGALNGALSFVTKPWHKKVVTVVVSVLLAAVVIVFYYAMSGEIMPSWPVFILISLGVVSASYALVTRTSASRVEAKLTPDSP